MKNLLTKIIKLSLSVAIFFGYFISTSNANSIFGDIEYYECTFDETIITFKLETPPIFLFLKLFYDKNGVWEGWYSSIISDDKINMFYGWNKNDCPTNFIIYRLIDNNNTVNAKGYYQKTCSNYEKENELAFSSKCKFYKK